MSVEWGKLPEWQRERADLLQDICTWIKGQIAGGVGQLAAYRQAVARWDKSELKNGVKATRMLRLSAGAYGGTMRREYKRWIAAGESKLAFVQRYGAGAPRQIPTELITEYRRRLTEVGRQYGSRVYRDLKRAWKTGCAIEGLGTWQEWWELRHGAGRADGKAALPLPDRAPDFPFSYATLQRYQPGKVTRALAERGLAAARDAVAHLTRDSSALKPCEVYTLDDKDFDLTVVDDLFGTWDRVRPTGYFMMDVGPRYIAGVVVRPGKPTQFDVDALIANTLATHGMGSGYETHILFERGTVACSPAREEFFQKLFAGRLWVHRTGMIQGYAYAGQFKDESKGRPSSKGMIEALMYKLDILLAKIPGQLGNRYQNKPAEAEARQRHAEDLAAITRATGVLFEMPLLRLSEFSMVLRAAIRGYNADHEHGCQGFHQVLQAEAQPGVWRDLPAADLSAITLQGDHRNAIRTDRCLPPT